MDKKLSHTENSVFPFGENTVRQKGLALKVCGMKYNTADVAKLQPDFLGFIFYGKSPRHFEGDMPDLPSIIKKVGVFVDAPLDDVILKIKKHQLHAVQLHGNESPEYCAKLKELCHVERVSASHHKNLKQVQVKVIKVFSIKDEFDFLILQPYEAHVDYFLFDTKGKHPGGNGYTFNWNALKDYPSTKPYFLSGGIGLNEMDSVVSFLRRPESKYCYAIDVNSKFELKPGLKNINDLEKFKKQMSY